MIPNRSTVWSPKSHFDFTFLIYEDSIEWLR